TKDVLLESNSLNVKLTPSTSCNLTLLNKSSVCYCYLEIMKVKRHNIMQKLESYSHTRTKTFDLIITSLLIALVFVSTVFLNIKLPIRANGGLVHLGTAMLFIASILFGPKKGAIAGSFGMALFDIVGGWLVWTPITFIARGLQGYIVGKIAWSGNREGKSVAFNLLAMIVSVPPMI